MENNVERIKESLNKIEDNLKFTKVSFDVWNDDVGKELISQINSHFDELEYSLWSLLHNMSDLEIDPRDVDELEKDNQKLSEILNKSFNWLQNRGN